jgi:hypothetical protein
MKAYFTEVTAAEYFYSGGFFTWKIYYAHNWKEF